MPPVLSPHPPPPGRRPLCAGCQRPLPACLCRWVEPTANQVPLLILQHPMEAHEAKGSVRLLQRCLQHCQVEVGDRFDSLLLANWLQAQDGLAARHPVLLYPADASQAPAARPPDPAHCRLVLLDGTWGKTLRLLQDHPLLQALPRWALPRPPPSRYRVRRAHRPEQRSTLEAACLALGALEGEPPRYAPLLAAFDGWVDSLAARR
ncbi:MAG: DTW domain-containing protein, partial [Burkholderiales bacterium PBB5]